VIPHLAGVAVERVSAAGRSGHVLARTCAREAGIRDYIHVWDPATADVAALTRFDSLPEPATAINPGTGSGTTVRELLGMFNRVSDRPVRAFEPASGQVTRAALTRIGRAARLLAWKPPGAASGGV
jgi:UDP-glucose 4-epimerase